MSLDNKNADLANIKVAKLMAKEMKIQATIQDISITKIWEDAGSMYLKSKGIRVNMDGPEPQPARIAENTQRRKQSKKTEKTA